MKTRFVFLFAPLMWLGTASPGFAQGTAFTYQGRLTENGAAANGTNDFSFTLYNAASGGAMLGLTLVNDLPLTNGLFTATLDFTGVPFDGSARWLQIAVRPGASGGAYTNLDPRQPITATPYAITAGNLSGTLPSANLSGTYANAVTLNNGANSFSGNGAGLTNLNASRLASGTVPAGALSNAWKTIGNAGATPGANFIGTTDTNALELKVNNQRGLRLEPTGSNDTVNVIGGSARNVVGAGVVGATIGGGGSGDYFGFAYTNRVESDFGTVSGGLQNRIQTNASSATIGGGGRNTIQTNANFATIPGGRENSATDYAFAAGRRAKANHTGAFVWADATDADFASTANNQFLIRAAGNVGINKTNPATALDVNGTITATGFVGHGGGLTDINAGILIGMLPDARLTPNVALRNGGNTFSGNQIFNSGNVGIGIPNPAAKLDVAGNLGYSGQLTKLDVAEQSAAYVRSYDLWFGHSSRHGSPGRALVDLGSSLAVNYDRDWPGLHLFGQVVLDPSGQNTNGTLSGGLLFGGSGSGEGILSKRAPGGNQYGLDFYTFFQPRLSIANSGNVGIGTNNPQSALHVAGTVRWAASSLLSPDQGGSIELGDSLGSGTVPFIDFHYGVGSGQDYNVRLINNSDGQLTLEGGFRATGTVTAPSFNGAAGTTLTLGTTGDQAMEFKVNGTRALRLEPTANEVSRSGMVNVVGGSPGNFVGVGASGATIAGGGAVNNSGYSETNKVTAHFGTVGGGAGNSSGYYATVGGGIENNSSGLFATVSGGAFNTSTGSSATVPGGAANSAGGRYSFAAGYRAKANHDSAFVWADYQEADFASTGTNQFNIRASGGVRLSDDTPNLSFGTTTRQMLNLYGTNYGIGVQFDSLYFRCDDFDSLSGFSWYKGGVHSDDYADPGTNGIKLMHLVDGGLYVHGTFNNTSDRNAKQDFAAVDSRIMLEKVAQLPIQTWAYKSDPGTKHLGPVAQDFHAAFGIGPGDKHIATVDADGVALAAIQGLNQKVEEKEARIAELEHRLDKLERLMKRENGGAR